MDWLVRNHSLRDHSSNTDVADSSKTDVADSSKIEVLIDSFRHFLLPRPAPQRYRAPMKNAVTPILRLGMFSVHGICKTEATGWRKILPIYSIFVHHISLN